MCQYMRVVFGCGHSRYTVRDWCTDYELSHIRCPPKVVDVVFRPDDPCGDCRKPAIHPDWVVRIQKGFNEKLVLAPTRPLILQTLTVTKEKLQDKAICVRPPPSSLLTTTIQLGLLSPLILIRLSCGSRSTPRSIQPCLSHPWFTFTMNNSVCTTVTPGDLNLGDTSFTHETTGRMAGLTHKKRKRISPEGVEEGIGIRKLGEDSDLLTLRTTPEGVVDIQHRKQSCTDEDRYMIGTDSVTLPVSDLAQALKVQKDYQVLLEASQQLEKMLSRSGVAGMISSEILSLTSSVEMILLSCTTAIDGKDLSTLSNWQSSRDWSEEEKEAFCRKFTYFMPGYWGQRDILGEWENLYEVLTKRIYMWGTKVCVKVGRPRLFGNSLQGRPFKHTSYM